MIIAEGLGRVALGLRESELAGTFCGGENVSEKKILLTCKVVQTRGISGLQELKSDKSARFTAARG